MANKRLFFRLTFCGFVVSGALLLAIITKYSAPIAPVAANFSNNNTSDNNNTISLQQPSPIFNNTPANMFIGRNYGVAARRINTILTTRKGGAIYQALIRYEPEDVAISQAPDANEIIQALAQQNKQAPDRILRIDEECEMLMDNLGEMLRSVTSYRAWCNPLDGRVLAYDLAQTTGGQAQRLVGRINARGVNVTIFRGNDALDRRDIPLSSGTFIPVEMEFIHQWYQANKDARAQHEATRFSLFIPTCMTGALLIARPMADQVIPIRGATYDCARYEVQVGSLQAEETLRARQEFWFDKRSGFMMKREDIDASLKPGEAPVTERAPVNELAQTLEQIRPLIIRPPTELLDRKFPYSLGQNLTYTMRARDTEIGRAQVVFNSSSTSRDDSSIDRALAPFMATAIVAVDAGGALRRENATTYFDREWRAVVYNANGDERVEAKAKYTIDARLNQGKLDVLLHRELLSSDEMKNTATNTQSPVLPSLNNTAYDALNINDDWRQHNPLRRVPISDEDAAAQEKKIVESPRPTRHSISRALSSGVYLYDFNRVEHIAALAYRLPLPALKSDEKVAPIYQNVAIFCARQNRCAVLQFEIKPEPKPVLTKAQQRHLNLRDRNEPQLYIATSTSALLPCRLLLTSDGRLLELVIKFGSGDVIYTLDDPIMRRRAEQATKQKLQEGPQLLRPPWWNANL